MVDSGHAIWYAVTHSVMAFAWALEPAAWILPSTQFTSIADELEPESLEVEESSLEPHAARTIEMPATAAVTARVFMFFTKVLRLLG